jgi:hypothetical protein
MHRRGRYICVLGAGVAALFSALADPAAAATLTVTSNSDAGPGSLRAEIGVAGSGDTIIFNPGLGVITLASGALSPLVNLTIDGSSGTGVSIVNASDRVFDFTAPGLTAITLRSLTLNGTATDSHVGGAVRSDVGTGSFGLTIDNCTLTGSQTFSSGGAFGSEANDSVTITNSTLVNSVANTGGALFLSAGAVTISQSAITGNTATQGGGGILQSGGILTLSNVTLANNNTVIAGGGILLNAGTLSATNVTVSGNAATGIISIAGGILQQAGTLTLVNSIVAGNAGGGGPSDLTSTGGSLTGTNDLIQAIPNVVPPNDLTGVIIGVNPQLGPLANNGGPTQTEVIGAGSRALDAGDAADCPAVDQRGDPRPAMCSLGAFEPAFALTPVPTLSAWAALALAALMGATGLAALGRRA